MEMGENHPMIGDACDEVMSRDVLPGKHSTVTGSHAVRRSKHYQLGPQAGGP